MSYNYGSIEGLIELDMAVTGEMQLLCLHVESMVNYGTTSECCIDGEVYCVIQCPETIGDTFRVNWRSI